MFKAAFVFFGLLIFTQSSFAATFIPICNRRPAVRDMIVSAFGKPCDQLTAHYFSDQYSSATLEIKNTQLTEIQANDFQDLHLDDVHIEGNAFLTTISHGAFADIQVRGNVVIRGNPVLTQIDSLAFQNIIIPGSLLFDHTLEISNNASLKVLAKNTFSNIEGLGAIRVFENPSLEKIEGLAFSGIRSDSQDFPTNYEMSLVEIRDNPSLKELAPGFLDRVSMIKQLVIANNPSLQTLPSQMISNCSYADKDSTIEIRDNVSLSDIEPSFLVSPYMNEPTVILSGNNSLVSLKTNSFASTRFQAVRVLNNPSLSRIEESAFHDIEVSDIVISGNPSLTSIAPRFITDLKYLRSVEISNNDALVQLQPETFHNVVVKDPSQYWALWSLLIHGNQSLTTVHSNAIHGVVNLQSVEISENPALTTLDREFIGELTYADRANAEGLSLVLSKNANLVSLSSGFLSGSHLPMSGLEISQNASLARIDEGAIDLVFFGDSGGVIVADNPSLKKLSAGSMSFHNLNNLRISGNPVLETIESGALYGDLRELDSSLVIQNNPALTSLDSFATLTKLKSLTITGTSQVTNFGVQTLKAMAPANFTTDATLVQSMNRDYASPQFALDQVVLTSWPIPHGLFSNVGLSFRTLALQNVELGEVPANSFSAETLGLYAPLEVLDLTFTTIRGPVREGAYAGVGQVRVPSLSN